jgi:hypothetical protein
VAALLFLAVVQFHSPDPPTLELAQLQEAPSLQPGTEPPHTAAPTLERYADSGYAQPLPDKVPAGAAPPTVPPIDPTLGRSASRAASLDDSEDDPASVAAAPPTAPKTTSRLPTVTAAPEVSAPYPRPTITAPVASTPAPPALGLPVQPAFSARARPLPPDEDAPLALEVTPPSDLLQFSRAHRERINLQSPPLPEVLRSFQFGLQDNIAVIIDADGSAYQGPVQSRDANDTTRFTVTGTNRTSQQRVVFEGQFYRAQTPPVRIHGQATLDGHTRFEIRAYPPTGP